MSEQLATERAIIDELVGDQPGSWDVAGELPAELLRKLGAQGVLCAEVPAAFGGLGAGSRPGGELTAHVGSRCSSLRSIMTSQGMAAWTIQRFGHRDQRRQYLAELTSGQLAAIAFSEPAAGSDLSAMRTEIGPDGDSVVVNGQKMWVTGSRYADMLVVLGRHGDGAAFVVVPASAPGVHLEPIADPLGCRAAGHAHVRLDNVRLPGSSVLGGGGQPLSLLFTTALSYGRLSVAWGCVGIVRACLASATGHAKRRKQSGRPLAEHQLIAGHLSELLVAEQVSTRVCEHASQCWDSSSPDLVVAAVLAKHVSAGHAARSASLAVQVLASAGAEDGHAAARAYRDAKLMEIIEGSNEICQLILAQHALSFTLWENLVAEKPTLVKCLVWDLDNTLWRGTLLEDPRTELPGEIRDVIVKLDSRGILQSIASKNDHDLAWRRLEELGIAEYFVHPRIGWGRKSDSVCQIADQLKFALTTMAFIDDLPSERAEVTFRAPEVRCYPAEQAASLAELPEFSPEVVTVDARRRRRMYQASFCRDAERESFSGPDEEFLRSLDLVMTIKRAGEEDLSRVEELTLRTSQMNATGVHYPDAALRGLLDDRDHEVLTVTLADRFGPHGAVGVLLLEYHRALWHLKLLATSCRVVSFGAGAVILNWLIDQAARAGVHLAADFRPTDRNRMMEIAYRFAGFAGDPCECTAGLGPVTGVQRLHLSADPRPAPATMRLVSPDLAATR